MAEIILVHGAWHGSWCWTEVAAGREQRGHDVTAVCLPGHDQPGSTTRIWPRISHYLDAVARSAESSTAAPVLVGHSMGGYVVQRYLETNNAACGVLVASHPRSSPTAGASCRTSRHSPSARWRCAARSRTGCQPR